MIVGYIGAVICWIVSKSTLATIIVFYLVTGVIKSLIWKSMHPMFLPSILHGNGALIKGIIFWPIITIANFRF